MCRKMSVVFNERKFVGSGGCHFLGACHERDHLFCPHKRERSTNSTQRIKRKQEMKMVNCRLPNLILSLLGLTAIISPGGVWGQRDENGIFISCGGSGFTDKDGNKWLADTDVPGYNPPGGRYTNNAIDIKGTDKQDLYRSERFHNSYSRLMEMNIKVPPGLYEVKLHFSEIFIGAQGVDRRVFDVLVQDVLVYNELDIFALVGSNTALTINAASRVNEGDNLRIVLRRIKQNPKISGIEIRPTAESLEEFKPIYINCGGGDYTDSVGRLWSADKYFDATRSPSWRTQTRNIKETEDDELYRTERYSTAELDYEIPGKSTFVTSNIRICPSLSNPSC